MKKVLQFDTADNRLHQVAVLDGGDLSVFSAPNAVPKGNADGKIDASWIDGTTGGSTSSGGMENPMRAGGDLVVGGPQQLLNYVSAAQGATVTAREQWGNHSPTYAIDGNDATPWESNTPLIGAWIRIDLGQPRRIEQWRVLQEMNDPGSYAPQYRVQTSDNDADWIDRETVLTTVDTGLRTFSAPITARYWRLIADSGGPWGWNIYSVELCIGLVTGHASRLPIGADNQTLTVQNGMPTWKTKPSIANPMIAAGDLIVGAPPQTTNVALLGLGATITGSSGWYGPAGAIDGNDATYWQANFGGTQWLRVDLQTAQTIAAWRVHQLSSNGAYTDNYRVQSSPDDIQWTDQARIASAAPADSGVLPLAAPATARYWRVYCANCPGPWAISSFELHTGSPAGTPTRLPIGAEGQQLAVVNGTPAWTAPARLWLVEHTTGAASGELVVGGLTYGMRVTTNDAAGAQIETQRLLDMSRTWIALAVSGIRDLTITRPDGTTTWLTQTLTYQAGDLWAVQ